jgi:hypothetical protein
MIDTLSLAISAGSFAISATIAWLTLFRSGKLKMTRPTLFYFGPDGDQGNPKIFLRALLYSTAKRGMLVENMYVSVSKGDACQSFNIWIYREEGRLSRGSGLHVDQVGRTLDHHFLASQVSPDFKFTAGEYTLRVYAKLVRIERPILLQEVSANLTNSITRQAESSGGGVFFDWAPDIEEYYVDSRPPPTDPNVSLVIGMRTKARPPSTF